MTDPTTPPAAARRGASPTAPYERRWLALAVIAVTVLMVILDATIVNIALPAVSRSIWASAPAPSSGSSPPTR